MLITAASKYGATAEIAGVIGSTLAGHGHDVSVVAPRDVSSVTGYDAFVIGSAVYAGHWLDTARDLVATHSDRLRSRPVWLFSSGPLGNPPRPDETPVDVSELVRATGAAGHAVFAGKLDRARLRFAERAIVQALHAPEGDFRDWDEIRGWAKSIAAELPSGRA